MNKTKIVFGIGIVLAVLAVFTAPVAADNVIRLEPSSISCGPGEEVTDVWVYLNATDNIGGFQIHLKYEDDIVDIVNITNAAKGTNPDWITWDWILKVAPDGHHYLFSSGVLWGGEVTGDNIELAKITLKGLSPGTRPLEFLLIEETGPAGDPTEVYDKLGDILSSSVVDGTFTCLAPQETYSKPLELGWNLISLPLTPSNNSASKVLETVTHDAVYRYRATAPKKFESVSTMDPGMGYFVNVSASGQTWTYSGTPYKTMNVSLAPGLNMVGWLNCSNTIGESEGDALSSLDGKYNYVAMFNATSKKFEAYNPHAPSVFNDFTTMDRGTGYFISARAGCPWLNESCPP